MFCPNCGEHLENNAVFCSNCGERLRIDGAPLESLSSAGEFNAAQKTQQKNKSSFSAKKTAILVACFVLFAAIVGLIGFSVASARPENVAKAYTTSYYSAEIKKADKKCLVTMKDQWLESAEKYHDGDKKTYFKYLSSLYDCEIGSFSDAYRALENLTRNNFEQYYGEDYEITTGKYEKIELSSEEQSLVLNSLDNSEFADRVDGISKITDIIKVRVEYVIDGNLQGDAKSVELYLLKTDGKWKVHNPLIFGWG